jgi:hypothetical protein
MAQRDFEVDLINPELMMWRELVKRASDVPGPFFSSETIAGELLSWLFGTQEIINPKGVLY